MAHYEINIINCPLAKLCRLPLIRWSRVRFFPFSLLGGYNQVLKEATLCPNEAQRIHRAIIQGFALGHLQPLYSSSIAKVKEKKNWRGDENAFAFVFSFFFWRENSDNPSWSETPRYSPAGFSKRERERERWKARIKSSSHLALITHRETRLCASSWWCCSFTLGTSQVGSERMFLWFDTD